MNIHHRMLLSTSDESRIDAALFASDAPRDARSSNPNPSNPSDPATPEEAAAAALHRAHAAQASSSQASPSQAMGELPAHLRRRLEGLIDSGVLDSAAARSEQVSVIASGVPATARSAANAPSRRNVWLPLALAAAIALAASLWTMRASQKRLREVAALQETVRELEARAMANATLLATANERVATLDATSKALAQRELALAQQLADASAAQARLTQERDEVKLRIAALEAPVDPATLQQNRTKLLEVPGSVRLAWSPFNVEGAAPAEQLGLSGDVVWNDELQTGYLRFVGLQPNDPNIEQYQVWVIDERGLEQKVSGGVFNVTAQGEVIVPIKPGIDVGRVALFAVTVEKPGGTWVPDLRRRLVVAPRG